MQAVSYEPEFDCGNQRGAYCVDLSQGSSFGLMLIGDCEIVLGSGAHDTAYWLRIKQDAAGGHQATLPNLSTRDGEAASIGLAPGTQTILRVRCLAGRYFLEGYWLSPYLVTAHVLQSNGCEPRSTEHDALPPSGFTPQPSKR